MRRPTLLRACASILLLAGSVAGVPELSFPLNSQLPPVAYASQQYSYTFAASTFRSNEPPITYSLEGAPQWLSLDPDSRTLQGVPGQADVGAIAFQLVASDASGRIAAGVVLIVADQAPLREGESIQESLRSAGQVQEPSSLFLDPLVPFTITFSQNIFSGASSSTSYYAVSGDDSPLPSWVQFDTGTLRMTGFTPTIVNSSAQQQTYGFKIVATNVPGFAEASVSFAIVVARALFLFQVGTATLNVTRGEEFQTESFRGSLFLDGQPITDADLASVKADVPQWITLESSSITLSGKVPDDFSSQTITVTAENRFGNQAVLSVVLSATSESPETTTDALNITANPGEYLSFTLPRSITEDAAQVTLERSSSTSWLAYSSDNYTLHGLVPNPTTSEHLTSSLVVTAAGSQTIYPINILVRDADNPSSSTTASTTTSSAPSTSATGESRANDTSPNTQPQHILAIVLVTVLTVLAVLAIIIFCLCWRRRKEKKVEAKEEINNVSAASTHENRSSDLPRPHAGVANGGPAMADAAPRNSESDRKHTPVTTPQVDLPWAPDSIKKARLRFLRKSHGQPNQSFDSNWSGIVKSRNTLTKPPTGGAKRGSVDLQPVSAAVPAPDYSHGRRRSEAERRQSSRLAQVQRQRLNREPLANHPDRALSINRPVSGLPDRSAAGVGHGSPILSPPSGGANAFWRHSRMPTRSSWATTLGSAVGKENQRPSVVSAHIEDFPVPPPRPGQYGRSSQENDPHDAISSYYGGTTDNKAPLARSGTTPVLRLVSPSSSESREVDLPPEDHSFNSKLQKYHEDRSRADLEALSHFSNGSNSRTPSLSRFVPGMTAYRGPSSTFDRSRSGGFPGPIAEEYGPGNYPSSPPTRGAGSGNWSKWPLTSDAESSMGALRRSSISAPQPQRPGAGAGVTRAVSVSSGQFSSAMSSSAASEWEDVEPHASTAIGVRSPPMPPGSWGYAYGYLGASAREAPEEIVYEMGVDENGERQWTTTSSSGPNSAVTSPRLPFEGGKGSTGDEAVVGAGMGVGRAGSSRRASGLGVTGLKLADRRQKVVSVEGTTGDASGPSSDVVTRGPGSKGNGTGKGPPWGGRERSRRGSLRFI